MLELFVLKHYNRAKASRMKTIVKAAALVIMGSCLLTLPQPSVVVNAFVPQLPASSKSVRQISSRTSSRLNEGVLDRFTNPKIDDPRLPLTEAGIAQIVAPTLQLFWLRSLNSPFPSWANPIYDYTFVPRGAFLAPTLIHGAALSCCWLLGCLAAKGYERESFEGELPQVLLTTIKAGAFACGCLIMGTQIDLYLEMGGYVQIGDSPETDLRIYRALVEIINDIFFEATTLLAWRAVRSKSI